MTANNESGSDDSLFGGSSSSQTGKKRQQLNDGESKSTSMDRKGTSDSDDAVVGSSSSSVQPEKKRRKLNEDSQNANSETSKPKGASSSSTTVDPVLLQHAKSRLSKFAARLFDPNRIKGLVEAPMTIPLNDEFLKAFGKREREMDKKLGREENFDHEIADEDEETENIKNDTTITPSKTPTKKKSEISVFKVKVNNLAYRTSEETLYRNCLQFGNLVDVNMILDGPASENPKNHNSGRAYVTFETEEGAQSCIEGLKSLDGRQLRCNLALAKPPKTPTGAGRTSVSLLNNQSTKDISTVCFRCGQVGHITSDCPNPAKPKPCCLCGNTNHDFRNCPSKQICFNCGQPGHVSRDCTMRRGLPRRMVCGTCFQSGHHRLQCHLRNPPQNVWSAVCMDCGRKGHFMCKKMTWFYGLKGMSCFNCGSQGHSGYDCNRPTLYQCSTNPDMAVQEIERAEANSIAEELERERRQQRERGNYRNGGRKHNKNGDGKRNRSKSSGPGRRDRRGY